MDREIAYALMVAVAATLTLSLFYVGGRPAVPEGPPVYAPEDIRYPLQQEELRKAAKRGKQKSPPPAESTDSAPPSDEQEDAGAIEAPPAEEPPIE
jgi:hypothetical protein